MVLAKKKKLVEFYFSVTIDGAIKDGAAKIGVAEMKFRVSKLLSAKWLLKSGWLLESTRSSKLLNE